MAEDETTSAQDTALPPLSGGAAQDPELSESRRERLYNVYSAIAEAMPLEGRDYRLSFRFGPSDSDVSVSFQPLNEFGLAFCRQAADRMKSMLGRAAPQASPDKSKEQDQDQGDNQ